jgi:hypothetical protein
MSEIEKLKNEILHLKAAIRAICQHPALSVPPIVHTLDDPPLGSGGGPGGGDPGGSGGGPGHP